LRLYPNTRVSRNERWAVNCVADRRDLVGEWNSDR
jgi:hypothetical protein